MGLAKIFASKSVPNLCAGRLEEGSPLKTTWVTTGMVGPALLLGARVENLQTAIRYFSRFNLHKGSGKEL